MLPEENILVPKPTSLDQEPHKPKAASLVPSSTRCPGLANILPSWVYAQSLLTMSRL